MAVAALGGPVGGLIAVLCLWTWRTRLAALVRRDVKPYDPAAAKVTSITNLMKARTNGGTP